MLRDYALTDREKCLLSEYLGTGLTPGEIREIKREAAEMREYIEWLEEL